MASKGQKYQPPRGTRDFFPADMAVRRHIESAWRDVSTAHGFDEIEGPNFEHLELYTVKSGEGIVSELFSFRRSGGETDYALRPEFTPTLARMVAAHGNEYPKPIRWFCIPNHFRAERPQRGRLREFLQWNADVIGDESPRADAEVIAVTVGVLERLGLTPRDVKIKISDRTIVHAVICMCGVEPQDGDVALSLIDRRDRITKDDLKRDADAIGFSIEQFDLVVGELTKCIHRGDSYSGLMATHFGPERRSIPLKEVDFDRVRICKSFLADAQLSDWCAVDLSIVRGLAYYTGTVFEVHEATGKERAIAGGGRYDNLVELFGGPPTPAVGIAMGDVVLRLVLEDKGLIAKPEQYLPRPEVFVISAGSDEAEAQFRPLVARLRRAGFHTRHSDRATRNVGKLLGDAGKCRSHLAVILGEELNEGRVSVKNLDSGEQSIAPLDDLETTLRAELAKSAQVKTM